MEEVCQLVLFILLVAFGMAEAQLRLCRGRGQNGRHELRQVLTTYSGRLMSAMSTVTRNRHIIVLVIP